MSGQGPRAASGGSLVGEVLGSYRLVAELSTGGMGTVYRAQHELLGRSAAIKLLRPELSENDVLVQRFFNEAKAATAIRHPGIVEVYDFGYTEDGRAYFVMEFLEGEPLGARIKRRGHLTEAEAATIARGIAASLRAAHAKGIIHRDLKPDNVFLVPDGEGAGDRVKVLDFGVAKLTDPSPTNVRHTQTGVLMGTPLYMAPEQARAAAMIDHRADLYSLGCILYELLVGQPPFLGEGAGEIIAMQLFNEPQRPSERVPVSAEMEAIVMRLLAKEPRERFQEATEVLAALTDLTPGSSMPDLSRSRMPTPMPPTKARLQLGLLDERPVQPPKKSALPIIAGVAAGAAFFVLSRGGDDEPKKDVKAATPTTPATPATPATDVKVVEPAPPKPAAAEPPKKIEEPPPPKQAAVVTEPPKPVEKPKPVKRGDKPGRTEKPTVSTGPVVKPSESTSTTTTGGPTTRPGMQTTEGAPIEPDLGEPVKKPN